MHRLFLFLISIWEDFFKYSWYFYILNQCIVIKIGKSKFVIILTPWKISHFKRVQCKSQQLLVIEKNIFFLQILALKTCK